MRIFRNILIILLIGLVMCSESLCAYSSQSFHKLAAPSKFSDSPFTDLITVANLLYIRKQNGKLYDQKSWIELAYEIEQNAREIQRQGLASININEIVYMIDFPHISYDRESDVMQVPITDGIHSFYLYPKNARIQVDGTIELKDCVGDINIALVSKEIDADVYDDSLDGKRVLFLSTRLNHRALDGVSLEAVKWGKTLQKMGSEVYYFSGQTTPPPFVEAAENFGLCYFKNPNIAYLNNLLFSENPPSYDEMLSDELFESVWRSVNEIKEQIKERLYKFIVYHHIEYINAENMFFPTNFPLTLALVEIANELGLKIIAHNHDFLWERARFNERHKGVTWHVKNAITAIRNLAIIVINTKQKEDLSESFDTHLFTAPNVMDFDHPPVRSVEKEELFREAYNIAEDDILLLSPVRPVERKKLERTIDVVARAQGRLKRKVHLMITHLAKDEGPAYMDKIVAYAEERGVHLITETEEIGIEGGRFDLETAYMVSDMVIYTPDWEGWGNALVETFYYKKPVIIAPYPVYEKDIRPLGVNCIEASFDENDMLINTSIIDKIVGYFEDPVVKEQIDKEVEENYEIGKKYLSYNVIAKLLYSAMRRLDVQKPVKAYEVLRQISSRTIGMLESVPRAVKDKRLLIRFDVDTLPYNMASLEVNLLTLVHTIKNIKRHGREFGFIDFQLISSSNNNDWIRSVMSNSIIQKSGIRWYFPEAKGLKPDETVTIINEQNLTETQKILVEGEKFIPMEELDSGFLASIPDIVAAASVLGRMNETDVETKSNVYRNFISLYSALLKGQVRISQFHVSALMVKEFLSNEQLRIVLLITIPKLERFNAEEFREMTKVMRRLFESA